MRQFIQLDGGKTFINQSVTSRHRGLISDYMALNTSYTGQTRKERATLFMTSQRSVIITDEFKLTFS